MYLETYSKIGLKIIRPQETFLKTHFIFFYTCKESKILIGKNPKKRDEIMDYDIAFFPIYEKKSSTWSGFLNRRNSSPPVAKTFVSENYNIFLKHKISEWPNIISKYELIIQESLDIIIKYIKDGARILGT